MALKAGSVAADGTTPATVTVTVRDDDGNAVSGRAVALSYETGTGTSSLSATTDARGTALFAMTSGTATQGTILAEVGATVLTDQPTLSFHDCEYGGFVNGACAPPPFVLLSPAAPAAWGGVRPTTFVVADLDGNGLDDVVVADPEGQSINALVAYGEGRFAPRFHYDTGGTLRGVVATDVNGDAIVDVVAKIGATLVILHGNGDGTFGAPIVSPFTDYVELEGAVDLDGDGVAEIVGRVPGGIGVLRRVGVDTFGALATYTSGYSLIWGLALGDLDGDRIPDVATVANGSSTVEVRLGLGHGAFGAPTSFPTGVNPRAVAIADLDGDGTPDLVTANYGASASVEPRTVSVLLATGQGTFGAQTEFATGANPVSIVAADFDADGFLDIATADTNSGSVSLLRGDGTGALAPPIAYDAAVIPQRVAVARVDDDALPDLVLLDYGDGTVSALLGALGGFATPAPRPSPVAFPVGDRPAFLAVRDLNHDGAADLVAVSFERATLAVALGNGDGTFQAPIQYPTAGYPSGLAIADVDGDGEYDLVLAGTLMWPRGGEIGVFRGNGDGSFRSEVIRDVGTNEVKGPAVGDVTGDGRADVVVAGGPSALLLPGNGDGTFGAPIALDSSPPPEQLTPPGPNPTPIPPPTCEAVAVADLNGDGKLDVVATNASSLAQAGYRIDETVVLLGNGDGTFAARIAYATVVPVALLVARLDADAYPDIVVASNRATATLLRGNGDGTFSPSALPLAMGGVYLAAGDLDLDGALDLVSSSGFPAIAAHRNAGGGAFTSSTFRLADYVWDLAIDELDGDGRPDVAVLTERGVIPLLARAP